MPCDSPGGAPREHPGPGPEVLGHTSEGNGPGWKWVRQTRSTQRLTPLSAWKGVASAAPRGAELPPASEATPASRRAPSALSHRPEAHADHVGRDSGPSVQWSSVGSRGSCRCVERATGSGDQGGLRRQAEAIEMNNPTASPSQPRPLGTRFRSRKSSLQRHTRRMRIMLSVHSACGLGRGSGNFLLGISM